jgi:hypothetical protein
MDDIELKRKTRVQEELKDELDKQIEEKKMREAEEKRKREEEERKLEEKLIRFSYHIPLLIILSLYVDIIS